MKKLLLITGPNGVGKSTTAECILEACTRCAYVDADWCRAINPFPLTPATRGTVIANIHALLLNYLLCSDIETIIFPYALHGGRQDMLDTVLSRLRPAVPAFSLVTVVVTCSLEENIRRAQQDGRSPERIARGVRNTFTYYDDMDAPHIDTTHLTPQQTAALIIELAALRPQTGA